MIICCCKYQIESWSSYKKKSLYISPVVLLWDSLFSDDLKGELEEYVQKYLPGKIKVIRNIKREGLIRGRMIGAAHATGITSTTLLSGCWVMKALSLEPFLIVQRFVKSDVLNRHCQQERWGLFTLGSFFKTPTLLSQNTDSQEGEL